MEELRKRVKILENKLVELGQQEFVQLSFGSRKQKKLEKHNAKLAKLFEVATFKKYAFKLAYVGVNYVGLEAQTGIENTIEHQIFDALTRLMLVNRIDDCDYKRAGRTDKGVSALGNVISLKLRCTPNNDHLTMINRLLPDDVIRLTDQAEVAEEFNARYDCVKRVYHYYFYRENLNIEVMQKAALYFIGEHDFRNFCKLDVIANQNFVRTIYHLAIEHVNDPFKDSTLFASDNRLQLYCAKIEANAFLWHQIRCIMFVLFHIGRGHDEPEVVEKLLDIQHCVGKPHYGLAADHQLVLYECCYPEEKLRFSMSQPEGYMVQLYGQMKTKLQENYIKQFIYISMGESSIRNINEVQTQSEIVDQEKSQRKSQSLLTMARGPTVSDLIEGLKGKRKGLYDIKMQKVNEYQQRVQQEDQANE